MKEKRVEISTKIKLFWNRHKLLYVKKYIIKFGDRANFDGYRTQFFAKHSITRLYVNRVVSCDVTNREIKNDKRVGIFASCGRLNAQIPDATDICREKGCDNLTLKRLVAGVNVTGPRRWFNVHKCEAVGKKCQPFTGKIFIYIYELKILKLDKTQ